MNDVIYRAVLDMYETATQKKFNIKQRDTARAILFTLTANGKPYLPVGCTAILRAEKPSGAILYNNCEIDDYVISYHLTNQTTSEVGLVSCELELYGADGKLITSPKFSMRVEDVLYDGSMVESQDEFTALEQAIIRTENLNITASKSQNVSTVTVTRKDGSTETVNILDGERGSDGEDGEDGVGIASTVLNADYTLTITLTDGSSYTTPSIRGERG